MNQRLIAMLVSLAISSSAWAQPVSLVLVPLDASTVATGGTAVTALTAGHRNAGGWIFNPSTATVSLCVNQFDAVASGTTSAGNLTCIVPGQTLVLTPSGKAVSVVASDSAHAFSGYGHN